MIQRGLPLTLPLTRSRWLARLLCRGDIETLILDEQGRLNVMRHGGQREAVDLDAATTVFTGLVVLQMRCRGRRETLAIPESALGAEAHRRLRVWLRWRAQISTFRAAV